MSDDYINDYVTVPQAAESLGVTVGAVRNAITDRRLPNVKINGIRMVSRAALEEYRQRTRPAGYKPSGRPRKNPLPNMIVETGQIETVPDQEKWEEEELLKHLRAIAKDDRRRILELVRSLADYHGRLSALEKEREAQYQKKYQ